MKASWLAIVSEGFRGPRKMVSSLFPIVSSAIRANAGVASPPRPCQNGAVGQDENRAGLLPAGGLCFAIRLNRMSNKYTDAKQAEDRGNRFDHLTHP